MEAVLMSVRVLPVAVALVFTSPIWLGAAHGETPAKSGVDKLYILDCADGEAPDESHWTPGKNTGKHVEFPDHCYLIHHTQGWFLWDTGVADTVAKLPKHEIVFHEFGLGTGPIWRKPVTLADQLERLQVKPSGIKLIGLSHTHPDHAGNLEQFPNVTVLIQKAEYEWKGRQDTVHVNPKHPVKVVEGDYDVFGDGSLTLLFTPGHTPGHQSLLVRLPKTGPVILSGDVAHFQQSFDERLVPENNYSKEESLASMQRIADVMAKEHAQLWINHDKPQDLKLKKTPGFYE
jgi:N-acyl homoserine lactone hydrolase